ncbi:MAG: hypothetical protein HYZ75_00345 [Elusimicrobia bacterium]|nr:hypothetical protein [Elusimicrobiota bacterium]
MTLPEGTKTRLGKALGAGLWAGAVMGSAYTLWNAGRYEATLTGLTDKALMDALITCCVSAPLGWAFWAGFILKDKAAPSPVS